MDVANDKHVAYLECKDDDIADCIDERWFDDAMKSRHCCGEGCGGVREQYYGMPISVVLKSPPAGFFAPAPMASVFRRDLVECLRWDLCNPVIGPCIDARSGDVMDEWVSVYTPTRWALQLTRHDPGRKQRCRHCGSVRVAPKRGYSAPCVNDTDWHWRRSAQVRGHSTFVVSPHLLPSIRRLRLKRLSIIRYEVIAAPHSN